MISVLKNLEKVLYFANYIVLDKGTTDLQYKQVLTEREYQDAYEKWGNNFRVGMGAEAIKELLEAIAGLQITGQGSSIEFYERGKENQPLQLVGKTPKKSVMQVFTLHLCRKTVWEWDL